jgi:DNA-directed RNA polymerase specialized sigma24 family protein
LNEQRRDIGSRLENWARVYRPTRTIGVSATGAFCDRLEREANGEKPTGDRRKVDEEDAHAIELAMRHLSRRDRLMLRYCYIDQERPEAVCRKLSIAHRPANVFVTVFRQAQGALNTLLDSTYTTGRS